jgi:hypothetical protein
MMKSLSRHALHIARELGACFALVGAMYLALWPIGMTFPHQWVAILMCGLGVLVVVVTETIRFGFVDAIKRAAGIVILGGVVSLSLSVIVWGYVLSSWPIVAMSVAAAVALLWFLVRVWGRHLNREDAQRDDAPSNTSLERTRER